MPKSTAERQITKPLQLGLLAAALLACGATLAKGQELLRAETLAQEAVGVPGYLAPNAVLLVGFSRRSNAQVRPWWEALQAAHGEREFTAYNVSVIEGAPGFVQGMIRRALRRQAKASRKDHILLVTEGADAWRSLLGAEDDAAAHVVRLDAGGAICLQRNGALSDERLRAILSGDCETQP